MCRCNAVNAKSGMECGLPFSHHPESQHSKADGAVNISWSEEESIRKVPTFIIKASDPASCAVIRLWIAIASSFKKKDGSKAVAPEKLRGAEERIEEFRNYQLTYGTKVPD
jgi:hypothetical protein